ncbi:MAG: site-specific integrase [Acidobacteria bacterium]|nr:site-specific integrase [Acidobacteriota bacterium]
MHESRGAGRTDPAGGREAQGDLRTERFSGINHSTGALRGPWRAIMARKGDAVFKRGSVWRLDCRINGQRYQLSLGKGITRTRAKEIAALKRAAILGGEAGIAKRKRDISFEKASEEFLSWAKANKRPKTFRGYESIMSRLKEYFGGKKLSEIHPFLIEKYKQKRLSEGAKVGVNRELSRLRTLYNLCIRWKKYEGENPVKRFQMAPESRGRIRFLTEDEETALLNQAKEPLRSAVLIGVNTGLRMQSEGMTLTWDNVDFSQKSVTVEDHFAKNGETRTVPLNSIALEILKQLKATTPGPWVFMTNKGSKRRQDKYWEQYKSFRTAFENACKRANLSDVTPHVLRHTFASRLVMAGVDLRTVQELGGWKSLNMVQRYAHLSREHKQNAVELLANNSTSLFTTPASGAPTEKTSNLKAVNEMGR